MGAYESIENDTAVPVVAWWQLLGGGPPNGSYDYEVLHPNTKSAPKTFTLSLVHQVCVKFRGQDDKQTQICGKRWSPARADRHQTILVSDIIGKKTVPLWKDVQEAKEEIKEHIIQNYVRAEEQAMEQAVEQQQDQQDKKQELQAEEQAEEQAEKELDQQNAQPQLQKQPKQAGQQQVQNQAKKQEAEKEIEQFENALEQDAAAAKQNTKQQTPQQIATAANEGQNQPSQMQQSLSLYDHSILFNSSAPLLHSKHDKDFYSVLSGFALFMLVFVGLKKFRSVRKPVQGLYNTW